MLYIAIALLILISLPYREPFYNPTIPDARPENYTDHSKNRNFNEIEQILYTLSTAPSTKEEEKAYLEDLLTLIQTLPLTNPLTQIIPNKGYSTVTSLEHINAILELEFKAIPITGAGHYEIKNAWHYVDWLIKNVFGNKTSTSIL